MFNKKKFTQKQIGHNYQYQSVWDMLREVFSINHIIKFFVVAACVLLVGFFGQRLLVMAQLLSGSFTKNTVETLSQKLGEDMETDEMWNVNILLIGHGGADHAGGFLADSIIVASWSPDIGSVTMVSVPRDLYINSSEYHVRWKINSVFASAYYQKRDVTSLVDTGVDVASLTDEEKHALRMEYAAKVMSEKLSEIMGLDIPYYAIVDFHEFEALIDHLWGVDIDVPQRLYDTAYPDGKTYTTLSIPKGINHFDGATALKYARSRHSTSDFDRSRRQQQIIEVVVDKLMDKENFKSVSTLKNLYADYTRMVFTNVSVQEIIGAFQHINSVDHMFSFVLSTNCVYANYAKTDPGCFLYVPSRDAFGGSSVILPSGATPTSVSFYEYINHFVFFVAHNPEYLIENPRLVIENGIDKTVAANLRKKASGHAGDMAVKLKKYGFNIVDIDNAEEPLLETSLFVAGTGITYPHTLEMLRMFLDVNHIYPNQDLGTGVDAVLVLGNDYLEKMGTAKFNYNK